MTVFVSGHLDVTPAEFDTHYRGRLLAHHEAGDQFVVGDARGADTLAQQLFHTIGARFVVYHMHDTPRNHVGGAPTVGGFVSDQTRDAAMTAVSDVDVAWVRPGRERSGTAQNLARRVLPERG